jgi:2-isopropylmalate synthase
LIRKTFEALKGVKKAIVHMYNSTSTLQREVVFEKDQGAIIDIAMQGIDWIKEEVAKTDTKIFLEYSPESFTGTELDFAAQICNAVIEKWGANENNPVIINLPSTVEMATPNVYADQIEWMSNHLVRREYVIISAHTHNDRGTSVAASELSQLAGAGRVEGTLLSNGERTGNVDIITLALNLATQGIDPKLDFSSIDRVVKTVEECTEIETHVRHPYVGELVYTAFSGSHQDAIKKGMAIQQMREDGVWAVPYLPIDPSDVGRTYESIIRINSQSGKGGVAYILETEYNYILPKAMHPVVGKLIQDYTDKSGLEITKEKILELFEAHYFQSFDHLEFISLNPTRDSSTHTLTCSLNYKINGDNQEVTGSGNGPIDACKHALVDNYPHNFTILSYSEHSRGQKSSAEAVSYIQIEDDQGHIFFGVGKDTDITIASIKAMFCALNLAYA